MNVVSDSLSQYFQEIGSIPLLSPEEERELCLRARAGDIVAREQLVQRNLKLVVTVARDYEGYGVALEDLIAEGNVGLIEAARRVDPDKGAKFSTYASLWIKQAVRRALANQRSTVRLPAHVGEKIRAVRRIETLLETEFHRPPTLDEVSEAVGIKTSDLDRINRLAQSPTSLDAPMGDQGGESFGGLLADESVIHPSAALVNEDMVALMERSVFEDLDDRERDIVESRFGLRGEEPKTLTEIGQRLGVTRERIRQIQNQALEKLRASILRREDGRHTGVERTRPSIVLKAAV